MGTTSSFMSMTVPSCQPDHRVQQHATPTAPFHPATEPTRPVCLLAKRCNQVRSDSKELRYPLKSASRFQHHPPPIVIGQPFGKVIQQVRRTLHADEIDDTKTACHKFGAQLSWPVRVTAERTRTERRQATSPLKRLQFAFDPGNCLVQTKPEDPVHPGSPPRDRRCKHGSAITDDAARLSQGPQAVGPALEVVKRAEQQHSVSALVG